MLSQEYFNAIGLGKKSNSKHSSLNKNLNRNDIIRSNELVRDYKLLQKSHSLESIQDFINKKCYEVGILSSQYDSYVNRMKTITQRALSISKYSVEDAKYYLYALEGMPDVKGALQNLGKKAQQIFEKFLAMVSGLSKKAQSFISGMFLNNYVKFYNDFNPSNFNNLDAKIKAVKLPSDITKKILELPSNAKFVSELGKMLDQNNLKEDISSGSSEMGGMGEKEIYQHLFGSDNMPEKKEMTVGEFFGGAQKGTKPAMLEILSPNTKKVWDGDVAALKESTNLIKKAIGTLKKKESESNKGDKNAVGEFNKWVSQTRLLLAKAQSQIFTSFNIKVNIAGMVYNAAKVGCGKAKKGDGDNKDGDQNANPNPENKENE